eukprot:CAMPEP_0194302908 /NCGR_PEP_ID=MMETSP0171-20130528/769_1 /TAXON_ID=218684 /ORGANISM="Corethron pennatum, Strain L29A3" /LENGTH=112 /DNA_ID=CAMNT_0039053567 /DNA_START=263 /DNA_END=601 /DNA_ORIENTATION=-
MSETTIMEMWDPLGSSYAPVTVTCSVSRAFEILAVQVATTVVSSPPPGVVEKSALPVLLPTAASGFMPAFVGRDTIRISADGVTKDRTELKSIAVAAGVANRRIIMASCWSF